MDEHHAHYLPERGKIGSHIGYRPTPTPTKTFSAQFHFGPISSSPIEMNTNGHQVNSIKNFNPTQYAGFFSPSAYRFRSSTSLSNSSRVAEGYPRPTGNRPPQKPSATQASLNDLESSGFFGPTDKQLKWEVDSLMLNGPTDSIDQQQLAVASPSSITKTHRPRPFDQYAPRSHKNIGNQRLGVGISKPRSFKAVRILAPSTSLSSRPTPRTDFEPRLPRNFEPVHLYKPHPVLKTGRKENKREFSQTSATELDRYHRPENGWKRMRKEDEYGMTFSNTLDEQPRNILMHRATPVLTPNVSPNTVPRYVTRSPNHTAATSLQEKLSIQQEITLKEVPVNPLSSYLESKVPELRFGGKIRCSSNTHEVPFTTQPERMETGFSGPTYLFNFANEDEDDDDSMPNLTPDDILDSNIPLSNLQDDGIAFSLNASLSANSDLDATVSGFAIDNHITPIEDDFPCNDWDSYQVLSFGSQLQGSSTGAVIPHVELNLATSQTHVDSTEYEQDRVILGSDVDTKHLSNQSRLVLLQHKDQTQPVLENPFATQAQSRYDPTAKRTKVTKGKASPHEASPATAASQAASKENVELQAVIDRTKVFFSPPLSDDDPLKESPAAITDTNNFLHNIKDNSSQLIASDVEITTHLPVTPVKGKKEKPPRKAKDPNTTVKKQVSRKTTEKGRAEEQYYASRLFLPLDEDVNGVRENASPNTGPSSLSFQHSEVDIRRARQARFEPPQIVPRSKELEVFRTQALRILAEYHVCPKQHFELWAAYAQSIVLDKTCADGFTGGLAKLRNDSCYRIYHAKFNVEETFKQWIQITRAIPHLAKPYAAGMYYHDPNAHQSAGQVAIYSQHQVASNTQMNMGYNHPQTVPYAEEGMGYEQSHAPQNGGRELSYNDTPDAARFCDRDIGHKISLQPDFDDMETIPRVTSDCQNDPNLSEFDDQYTMEQDNALVNSAQWDTLKHRNNCMGIDQKFSEDNFMGLGQKIPHYHDAITFDQSKHPHKSMDPTSYNDDLPAGWDLLMDYIKGPASGGVNLGNQFALIDPLVNPQNQGAHDVEQFEPEPAPKQRKQANPASGPKERRKYNCGTCGGSGHNARSCESIEPANSTASVFRRDAKDGATEGPNDDPSRKRKRVADEALKNSNKVKAKPDITIGEDAMREAEVEMEKGEHEEADEEITQDVHTVSNSDGHEIITAETGEVYELDANGWLTRNDGVYMPADMIDICADFE